MAVAVVLVGDGPCVVTTSEEQVVDVPSGAVVLVRDGPCVTALSNEVAVDVLAESGGIDWGMMSQGGVAIKIGAMDMGLFELELTIEKLRTPTE